MKPVFLILVVVCSCILAGCKRDTQATDETPVLRLPIISVGVKNLDRQVTLPALVAPLADHSVKVSPAIAGKLTAVLVGLGQSVSAGQLVATIDSHQLSDQLEQARARVLDAQANVSQAKTNLLLAQNTEERTSNLVLLKVGAKKDLVAAQSQVQTAKAQLVSSQAKLEDARAAEAVARQQLSFAKVKTPIAGIVAQRFLDIGEPTDVNAPIILVENLSQVIITASLPTSEPQNVQAGDPVVVQAASYPNRPFPGTVIGINSMVENNGTTVGVRILCDNPGYALKDGMPTTATVVTAKVPDALVVPETALVDDPSSPADKMVYMEKNGVINRVHVKTGIHSGKLVQITSGLVAGERIVASGAYGIPDGTKVAAQ